MRRLATAGLLLLLTCPAGGVDFPWVGFPLEEDTNYVSWYEEIVAYNPISQLVAAVNFICKETTTAHGVSPVDPLSVEDTWVCSAGTNRTVTTNGGYVYTNWSPVTTNVLTTNQFSPFTYSYTDYDGTVRSATGFPYITLAFLWELDEKIDELFAYGYYWGADDPQFVNTAEVAGTSLDTWWAKTNASGEYPTAPPWDNKAAAFARLGVGKVSSLTTDGWGRVSDGYANWTRVEATTASWVCAAAHFTNYNVASWKFVTATGVSPYTLSYAYYDSGPMPIPRWFPEVDPTNNPCRLVYSTAGGDVAFTASVLSVTITGTAMKASALPPWPSADPDTQPDLYATQEVVLLTDLTTACASVWWDVEEFTVDTNGFNLQDSITLLYTGFHRAFVPLEAHYEKNTARNPFRSPGLFVAQLDERWRVLNGAFNASACLPLWLSATSYSGAGGPNISWGTTTSATESAWAQGAAEASPSYHYDVRAGTKGWHDGLYYRAAAAKRNAALRHHSCAVNVGAAGGTFTVENYVRPQPYLTNEAHTSCIFDANDSSLVDADTPHIYKAYTNHSGGFTTEQFFAEVTNFPVWVTQPGGSETLLRGVMLDPEQSWTVYHWTNRAFVELGE